MGMLVEKVLNSWPQWGGVYVLCRSAWKSKCHATWVVSLVSLTSPSSPSPPIHPLPLLSPSPPTIPALHSLLEREGIPVDELRVMANIKRDQRHASKPDTAALFKTASVAQRVWKATDDMLLILGGSISALAVVVAIFLALLLYALF